MSEISYIFAKTRLSMEIWRDIKGYDGLYQVSNEGRVKSLERDIVVSNKLFGYQIRHLNEKTVKPKINSNDRFQVRLCKNGIKKQKQIHIIVAEAFIPNPKGYTVVHHKDHNPHNNKVDNLEWMAREVHSSMHSTERYRDSLGRWVKN